MPPYAPLRPRRCSRERFGVSSHADCALGRAASISAVPLAQNNHKHTALGLPLPDFSLQNTCKFAAQSGMVRALSPDGSPALPRTYSSTTRSCFRNAKRRPHDWVRRYCWPGQRRYDKDGSRALSVSMSTVRLGQNQLSGVLASEAILGGEWHPRPHRLLCQQKICDVHCHFRNYSSRFRNYLSLSLHAVRRHQ